MNSRLRLLLIAPLAAALLTAAPAAAASNPFLHDLDQVNGHLRVAIEFAPEEMGEALRSAEVVCGLGDKATSRGEAEAAAADWSTLGQLVDDVTSGSSRRVTVAFDNADSVLRKLRERYEHRWAGDPRLPELRRGVRATHRGIRIMRLAIGGLETSFASWRAHECTAAVVSVESSFTDVPTGLELINVGMLRLWRLAGLAPSPTEGG